MSYSGQICMELDPKFSRRDVLDLCDRIERLHRARSFGELMVSSIDLLRPFFSADYWSVGYCDPRRTRVMAVGWPVDFPLAHYSNRIKQFAGESPLFQYWARTHDHDRVLRRTDCCDEEEFRRSSALYSEIFRPLRLTRQIGTWLRPGGGRHLEIGIHRGGRAEFSDTDVARFKILRTHILRAYLNVFDFEKYEQLTLGRSDWVLPAHAFELQDTSLSANIDRLPGERTGNVRLTPREREVLHWVSEGKTNQEIGIILGTSWRTVRKQLESVFQKLSVETRTAAAMRAVEMGLC
jgi:DNA-binding CsgD family transcriptional regulator